MESNTGDKKMTKAEKQKARNIVNGQIVAALLEIKGGGREQRVTLDDLRTMGYVKPYPTRIYSKYEGYWIRDMEDGTYLIRFVRKEDLQKREPARDANKPLSIDLSKKVNLRDLAGKSKGQQATDDMMKKLNKDKNE